MNKALDGISLKIGQALLPAVNGIATALTPAMTSIGQFVASNPYLVEGLAAAALAFTVVTVSAMSLAAVMGILTSPIGLIAAAIAAAVAVIVIGARLITNIWEPISGFFTGVWQSIRSATLSGIAGINQGWNDLEQGFLQAFNSIGASSREHWDSMIADGTEGVTRLAAGVTAGCRKFGAMMSQTWRMVSAAGTEYWNRATSGFESFKSQFNWSPTATIVSVWSSTRTAFATLIISTWQPVAAVFAALWDLLRASAQSIKAFLQGVFDWSPVESVMAYWEGLKGYFSGLWTSLTEATQPVRDTFGALFSQSPMESIKQAWEPVLEWFGELWGKLQNLVGPIRELLDGNLSGVVATITGNPVGAGESDRATSFFDHRAITPSASSGLTNNLQQNSGALIQQTAANNRTQLEGGLTVRFENAPTGLRTSQPQTNQPALSLNSRIGYRSLSLGGSNELA